MEIPTLEGEIWVETGSGENGHVYHVYSTHLSNYGRLRMSDGSIKVSKGAQIIKFNGVRWRTPVIVANLFLTTVRRPDQNQVHKIYKGDDVEYENSVLNLKFISRSDISKCKDWIKRISDSQKIAQNKIETRKAHSESALKMWTRSTYRFNRSCSQEKAMTEEYREKLSRIQKERYKNDPELRNRISKSTSLALKNRYKDDDARKKTGIASRIALSKLPKGFLSDKIKIGISNSEKRSNWSEKQKINLSSIDTKNKISDTSIRNSRFKLLKSISEYSTKTYNSVKQRKSIRRRYENIKSTRFYILRSAEYELEFMKNAMCDSEVIFRILHCTT